VLLLVLPLLVLDLVAAGLVVTSPAALVACIVAGGFLLGIVNTVLTESVMEATDLPRSVASSAYSAVRFLGGAAAPPVAALLWHLAGPTVPYLFAAGSVLIAVVIIAVGRGLLAGVDRRAADAADEGAAVLVGDAA
jgi:dipeptide/tripeptide permease